MGLPKFLEQPDPKIYKSQNYLVLDFETDGFPLDKGGKIVLTGYKKNNEKCQFIWGDKYALNPLFEELDKVDFLVAQNAKFELQWLSLAGYDIGKLLVFDTMLAEYILLGNRYGPKDLSSLGTKYVGESKGSLVSNLFEGGTRASDIPGQWLLEYNARDVELTERVFQAQLELLDKLVLLPVFFTRCITTVPLADIELRGLALDHVRVKDKLEETLKVHNEIKRQLDEIASGINWNSPKQVGALLYDKLGFAELVDYRGNVSKTATGNRRTDAECIGLLASRTPEQHKFKDTFLDYRKVDRSLNDLWKMQECVEKDEGILYARYNQAVTQSHRLSSSGGKYKLQFQNIDRYFKRLFRARNPEWSVGEADGRQLEFRVAVHLGNDSQGLKDVRANFDVHRNTASVLNRVPLDRVTSEQRTAAKPETFKPLYGGQSGTKSQRAYYAAFRERYHATYETQRGWCYEVLKTGKLRIASGLIFYWADTTQTSSGYITNTPSIFNYPVQSFATADIIPISLVFLWHLMRSHSMRSYIVNTVHDSIIAELRRDEEDLWKQLCKRAFTSDVFVYLQRVYGVAFTCPLGVETKIGTHWGTKEYGEEQYDLDPELSGESAV